MTERAWWVIIVCASCGGDAGGPRVAMDLPASESEAFELGAIAFPNDVLSSGDELDIRAEGMPYGPDADPAVLERLASSFRARACFGIGAGVVFPLADVSADDPVDPATLTDASVQWIDLERGVVVPSESYYRIVEQQIFARPMRGHRLRPGARYAAYVTTDVALVSGSALGAAPALGRALAPDGSDAWPESRTRPAFAPLRDYLDQAGVDPATVAGATVFTTCDPAPELEAVRAALAADAPPAIAVTGVVGPGELDALLGTPAEPGPGSLPDGIAHEHIDYIVLGTFTSPNYLADTPGRLGVWELDAGGAPVPRGVDEVPFILVIPKAVDLGALPVAVFHHGLNDDRGSALYVAESLASAGFATFGVTAPFHGLRHPDSIDRAHNFTDEPTADGLADSLGVSPSLLYFDIIGDPGTGALDPRVIADNYRQSAVDLMAGAHAVARGDWTALGDAEPALAGLVLDTERLPLVGESLGGIIGATALAFEPLFTAELAAVTGGGIVSQMLASSPAYFSLFAPIIGGAFGLAPTDLDPIYDPPYSHHAFQMIALLMDTGDPITYAERIAARGAHLIVLAAHNDESVPNQASEAFAVAAGLSWVQLSSSAAGPSHVDSALLPAVTPPVQGNVDGAVTGLFTEITPADHGMFTRPTGTRRFEDGFPPFVQRSPPVDIENPVAQTQGALIEFVTTHASDGAPTLSDL